jgi:uncharacterized Zn-finger protein
LLDEAQHNCDSHAIQPVVSELIQFPLVKICAECGKGFYRKDHLRKHIKSHLTKRAKEEAAHASLQETAAHHEITIKREKLSPVSSPRSADDVPKSLPLSMPHFSLPQEVTIHVSSIAS